MYAPDTSLIRCLEVVSGMNHHLSLRTKDTITGKTYILSGMVHRDISGSHKMMGQVTPQEEEPPQDRWP